MSEALRTYATLMDRLHRLIAAGNGESDEADAIRDAMDDPWDSLSQAEIELVRTLSKDLYDAHERRTWNPVLCDDAEQKRILKRVGLYL